MNDETFYFSFSHQSSDGTWHFNKTYEYGTTWPTVLTHFLNFLSGVYGYNINGKVDYPENPFPFEGKQE